MCVNYNCKLPNDNTSTVYYLTRYQMNVTKVMVAVVIFATTLKEALNVFVEMATY